MKLKLGMTHWAAVPVLAVSMLLGACGGGDDAPTDGSNTTAPVTTGTVGGVVIDSKTGAPIAGATVQAGALTTTTAVDGKFTLAKIDPADRVSVTVSKAGYADNVLIAKTVANTTTSVSAQLVPVAVSVAVNVTTGGTLAVTGSPAQVLLAANTLVRADGLPISGQVTARITPINSASNAAFMSGDYTATRANGSVATIESFGVLTISLVDATGAKVNLAAGKTATIRIPVSSRGTALATAPLFYFNETTGRWAEEGTAKLVGTDAATQYYEATVSRLASWSTDQSYETVNVTGCVNDAGGLPVAGARVVADGVDYTGTSIGFTNTAGVFTIPMKKSGIAALTAKIGSQLSSSRKVGPETANYSFPAGECLVATNLTVKLNWGTNPQDMDSHLMLPNGEHIFWAEDLTGEQPFSMRGSLAKAPYAGLNVDDTDGDGPEIISVNRMMVGTYKYLVHNYSKFYGEDAVRAASAGLTAGAARVELNWGGNTSVFVPPAGEAATSQEWNVFNFTVDANCKITVTPVNTWSNSSPLENPDEPIPGTTAATYCTPQ